MTKLDGAAPDSDEVLQYADAAVIGAGAVVTLDRPRALNALNGQMRETIAAAMPEFTRDPEIYALIMRSGNSRSFCAGGDVRELSAVAKSDITAARGQFAAEYELNWYLECFSKPTISLIDGMVMGSGVGLSAYGTHRIAGEGYLFAMPETAIGLFPDVGVASVLARLPHNIGIYLGLTGAKIDRADAFHLGLVTHCIDASEFEAITAQICDADPVDPVLDERHKDPGPGRVMALREQIEQCFSGSTIEQVLESVRAVEAGAPEGHQRDWAGQTLAQLEAAAPLSLKVTLRHIRGAANMDLRQTLITDYRIGTRFLAMSDFHEGVRAALIDKDGAPQWQPGNIEDVSDDQVEACFAPLDLEELQLKPRKEMQALR